MSPRPERTMASANAQIGVAIAAYFPDLTLMGTYGFSSSVINGLIKTPNNIWSFGGTLDGHGARFRRTLRGSSPGARRL